MAELTLEKTIYLAVPAAKVWSYLTDPEDLAKWFYRAEAPLAEGAPYTLLGAEGNKLCWGVVEEMVPEQRLKYSFTATPMNGLVTKVEWTLDPVPGGTRLSLRHSGFGDGDGFGLTTAFDAGWDKHLGAMRAIGAE